MGTNDKPGILLVNLGTPDAPTTAAVRRYLREFLSDPMVIDIPAIPRAILVNAIIVPFRSPKSAAAYRLVWTDQGSPLLANTAALADGVKSQMAPTPVEFAMRYGRPALKGALSALRAQGVTRLIVFPLYPQETQSSTGSTQVAVDAHLKAMDWSVEVVQVPAFHAHPAFVQAEIQVAREALDDFDPDHVLFSFHGLPERHIKKADRSGGSCLASPDCCREFTDSNRSCYRAQCYATADAIAAGLDLPEDRYSVAFQSRLGRTPWIQPFTDQVLVALARAGTRRLAVVCPAFVADCLETLEEIGIRASDAFVGAGGEALRLVPSLNADPRWIAAVVEIAREGMGVVAES